MEDINSVWNSLYFEANSVREHGTPMRLLNPKGRHRVYAAIRSSDFRRMIFFSVRKGNLPSIDRFSQTRAMEINSGKIPDEFTYAVCLILRDENYLDLFSVLATDIIHEIENESNEKLVVQKFVSRINTWIAFFEKYGDSGLSPQRVKGLFGELWFIRHYLLSDNENENNKISGWTGPDGKPHDFQFGKIAFEVKTTATKKPWKIKISNELQLDDFGLENLFLYHLAIREVTGGDLTLPYLIDEILNLLANDPQMKDIFLNMLFKSGYIDFQRKNYLQKGFIINEENFYKICEGFPRITGRDIPDGTGDVRYTVSLPGAGSFLIEKEKIEDIFGNLKNEL